MMKQFLEFIGAIREKKYVKGMHAIVFYINPLFAIFN